MQIRILEYTSDRTMLIELDLEGYDLLRFPKEYMGYGKNIEPRTLTAIVNTVGMHPLRYWSPVDKTYNKRYRTSSIYRTYVIKD